MSDERTGTPVGDTAYLEIQRLLYREAAFLDDREFREWLGLLTDDIRYRVTAQVVRDAASAIVDYAIIDEDAVALRSRVDQISNPKLTRAENPPSLTRRFVGNVQASHGDRPGEFVVKSNLLVYRNRANVPEGGFYAGERRDVLRRTGSELHIASRHVRLDQAVLYGGPVSILF
jgi:3-phenylpropionate/cinnamic acid dioxygenase small subunit